MASVTATADVTAAPQDVWGIVVDPSRYSSWLDLHHGFVGEAPSALTPGTSFGQRVKVMGMPADVRWQVEEVEAPARLALAGTGPMGIGLHVDYAVAQAGSDGASRVTVVMEFSGPAVMAMSSQLEQEVGGQLRSSLGKLKALAES